jgi:hypothetical protein
MGQGAVLPATDGTRIAELEGHSVLQIVHNGFPELCFNTILVPQVRGGL